MKKPNRKIQNRTHNRLTVAGTCLGMIAGLGIVAHAQSATDMEKQNKDLQDRLTVLEDLVKKEGLMPSGDPPKQMVSAMSNLSLSGFVQASYFYNLEHPVDGYSDGYLWNTKDNSFSLNKVKLTLASAPVATDKWDAAFKASLMFGDDVGDLNSASRNGAGNLISDPSFQNLREAYLELNVPIGTGLDIKAGELISLINWESGDGGAANPNFSEGNLWWFTGSGPACGIQLGYNFTDKIGLTLRVDNGIYQGPVDYNQGKGFSGCISLKPTDKLWVNFAGWYSQGENIGTPTDVCGVESIGGYQFTEKLGSGYEIDYFNFGVPGNNSDLYSFGGWLWYDFTAKVGLALRADYINSPDGALGPAVRSGAGILSFANKGDLGSVTLTLNLKPTPAIKIQPEVRYDYTTYSSRLDGRKGRFIVGCGATYSF